MTTAPDGNGPRVGRRRFLQGLGLSAVAARGRASAGAARAGDGPSFDGAVGFVEGELRAQTFPGAALVVTSRGKTVLEKYWGTYQGWDRKDTPCRAGMVNMLYSVSKLVASTVVVMARGDGLFDFDEPVSKYVPGFTGGGKDKIIIRHLLTHAAGLPGVPLGAVDTEEGWRAAVEALCRATVDWEPGSRSIYHGLTGHFLAAEVVRRVSGGKAWETICRERLFDPVGAHGLTYKKPGKDVPVSLTPRGPALTFPPDAPVFKVGDLAIAGHPAGGAFGTAADLLKVLQLHLNDGVWGGKTLVKPDALREMHRVQFAAAIRSALQAGKPAAYQSWGLGILVRGDGPADGVLNGFGLGQVRGPAVFGHAGIGTIIGVADPERDAALVFLTTDTPQPDSKVASVRSGVVSRVFEALT